MFRVDVRAGSVPPGAGYTGGGVRGLVSPGPTARRRGQPGGHLAAPATRGRVSASRGRGLASRGRGLSPRPAPPLASSSPTGWPEPRDLCKLQSASRDSPTPRGALGRGTCDDGRVKYRLWTIIPINGDRFLSGRGCGGGFGCERREQL